MILAKNRNDTLSLGAIEESVEIYFKNSKFRGILAYFKIYFVSE